MLGKQFSVNPSPIGVTVAIHRFTLSLIDQRALLLPNVNGKNGDPGLASSMRMPHGEIRTVMLHGFEGAI